MRRLPTVRILANSDLDRFIRRTISRLRWATIAALLAISLIEPSAGRTRASDWVLVVLFAGYTLLVERLARHLPGLPDFAWVAILDLPAVALLYYNCSGAGGPLFVFLVLAAAQTAVFMTLAGSLLYTAATGAIAVAVAPTFSDWNASARDMRSLSARLVILSIVGVGIGTVTRRLLAEQSLALTMAGETERLATLDRLRADFVAGVSHELRTPLTAARAGLGFLDDSAAARLEPDERGLLANARRNVERLNLLIDDLLAFNQLETGTLSLDLEPVDFRVVVMEAVAAVHPLLQEKAQALELDLPDPLPIAGDPDRLQQVLLNVIVNAHRYSPEGARIVVSGRVVRGEAIVSIHDDGPGIPGAELEAVFARFYRLAGAKGGSGLGLAVARGLVELHGGRIWAEGAAGAGSTFRIALPCGDQLRGRGA